MMRHLRLTEHRPSTTSLTSEELSRLRKLVPSVSTTPGDRDGEWILKPGSSVGIVRDDHLVVEIQPKIGIERLLFLVSYSLQPDMWADLTAPMRSDQTLVDAMATILTRAVRSALRAGVIQAYEVREESLLTVKGRVRWSDQMRTHHGRLLPIEVSYDEFTEDNLLNQILKSALIELERLPFRDETAARELRSTAQLLANVSYRRFDPNRLPTPAFNRLNAHYKTAVLLALVVLGRSSSEAGAGSVSTATFLINMNQVFEDFVTVALREALGLTESQFPQNAAGRRLFLDADRKIGLEPDLSWWEGERCVFVGDVKYKRTNAAGILHPDLYQLHSYVTATKLEEGLLVYAAGEETDALHEVPGSGKRLRVTTLDPSGQPDEILRAVSDVATSIIEIRGAELPVMAYSA
ncbi:MAG: hypothetical protein RIE08_08965 [Acidimicrobiales bacterium]